MKKLLSPAWLLLLFLTAACNKTSDSDIPDTKSGVIVYNMAPGDRKFDILLDTAVLGTDLAFGQSTNTYREFRAQKYDLLVFAAGDRSTPLIRGEINLRNNRNYSTYLTINNQNLLGMIGGEDDLNPSSSPDYAKFRVINLSDTYMRLSSTSRPERLPMDFYLGKNRMYRRVSYTGVAPFLEILKGTYQVDARWPDSSLSLLHDPNNKVELQAVGGKIYTLITTGKAQDSTLKITLFTNK